MIHADPESETPAQKLAWTAPRLEQLGTVDDIKSNGAQPPNDGSGSPTDAAS